MKIDITNPETDVIVLWTEFNMFVDCHVHNQAPHSCPNCNSFIAYERDEYGGTEWRCICCEAVYPQHTPHTMIINWMSCYGYTEFEKIYYDNTVDVLLRIWQELELGLVEK